MAATLLISMIREVVLEAGGLLRGSFTPALDTFLARQPGIHHAESNYLSDTVTVGYDETKTTQVEIERKIQECGLHCRGEVVPPVRPSPGVAAHAGHTKAAGHVAAGEMSHMAHEMGPIITGITVVVRRTSSRMSSNPRWCISSVRDTSGAVATTLAPLDSVGSRAPCPHLSLVRVTTPARRPTVAIGRTPFARHFAAVPEPKTFGSLAAASGVPGATVLPG